MFESSSKSPEDVLRRLEELRRWQEEQQQVLNAKQNSQRQLLGQEQRQIYEKLGFSSPSINSGERIVANTVNENNIFEKVNDCNLSGIFPVIGDEEVISRNDLERPAKMESSHLKSLNNNDKTNSVYKEPFEKKPFLRRGQGLTSRFNVDPDHFRLHNLPKYKYANTHRKFLPQTKFAPTLPKKMPSGSKKLELRKEKSIPLLDKPSVALKAKSLPFPQQNSYAHKSIEQSIKSIEHQSNPAVEEHSVDNSTILNDSTPISWAEVLNPNNIKSVSIESLRKYVEIPDGSSKNSFEEDELDNLSLFELLEKKAQDGSNLLDSSILKRWLKSTRTHQDDSCDHDSIDIRSVQKARVSPLPCDINEKIIIDDSDNLTASSDDDDNERDINSKPEKCRVRFSDEIVVNELDNSSDTDTVLSNEISSMDISKMSTPNDKQDYEMIRRPQLFAESTSTTEDDLSTTLIDPQKSELIEKTDLLKSRLLDLEKEIAEFQKHNTELIRLKQECQLEKIRYDEERVELIEKLNDERIKMEIQLHDERMRIEDEKKKLEKLIKDQRTPNRKEREEITKLKERVEQLQKENKDKECKHTAAQARLRAQIRNLEKDLKDFSFEIDHLKKEKKRLESENAKMMRNNNNKMLQEINKSIAKLVPKSVPSATEVKNKNPKSVVARVTSHSTGLSKHQSKSKNLPSLHNESNNSADSSTDEDEQGHSSYFKQKQKSIREDNEISDESNENDTPEDTAKSEPNDTGLSVKDDFKREIENADGSKDIWYTNGNLKKISADGMVIRMLYYNKDIKETNINEGTVKYYYSETNTWHTTYLDGLEILEFPNGQTEHRYKDGTIEVHFANGSIRISNPTDPIKVEEWRYPDGTCLVQLKNGDKILSMTNGQKEIHTKMHKRREYPDGTVKMVYPDGSQETRYSNGRIRLKDKDGNLVMDSEQI